MKRVALCALIAAGFCLPAFAATEPTPEMKALIEKPMNMDRTPTEKRHMVFNHSSHAKVDCAFCHHKAAESGTPYVGCAEKGCHDILDRKDKSEHSYYQAIHKKKVDKSCVGCHQKLAADNADLKAKFKGCNPCHQKGGENE